MGCTEYIWSHLKVIPICFIRTYTHYIDNSTVVSVVVVGLQLILIIFVGTLWLHPDINKGTYTDVVYGIFSEGIYYVYTT